MTYNEIVTALSECPADVQAFIREVSDEADELLTYQVEFNHARRSRAARETQLARARVYYADEITELHEEMIVGTSEMPDPQRILSHRRYATAWAVAALLLRSRAVR